jgi:Flp pilus assembly protein TadG
MMPQRHRSVRRHGTAAVEVAILLPLFLVPLLIGVWEVGRLVEVEQILANAAREGGRQAAAGLKDVPTVQQDVVTYLTNLGITASASDVTVVNLTDSSRSDPRTANQLDHFQVTVTIPVNRVRWILLNQVTSITNLTASADWYSSRDVPITVDTSIPL